MIDSPMYKTVYLKRGKDAGVKRLHPWIFSGAIAHLDDGIVEGDTVRVLDADGSFLAVGHYQPGSIAVRILSFRDEMIDRLFFTERIAAALRLRRQLSLITDQNTIYRLIHGEGDGLPALVVDVYGTTAVVQAHSVGMHLCRKEIASILAELMADSLQCVYYKSDQTLPYMAETSEESGYLWGRETSDTAIENGLSFHIDWLKGQKTGFFVDQRANRSLLEKFSKDKKVLNMFCYTGGFSVYAMRGGASMVHSVDSSSRAVEITDANIRLNFQNDTRHQSFACDAFKFLADMKEDYDIIVLDPPAFAKHRDALHNALKGYARLNAAAMKKIKKGGILFTFSCSQAVSPDQFRTAVFTAAARSGRFVRILHQLHQPADHPVSIYHPEGEYLKGLVLYVE